MSGPYEACHALKDDKPYVYGIEGPGAGLGYHSWYGYPQNTFATMEEAEKAARLMNIAFHQGELARARAIGALLK